jgi:RimJ/RimL family protein N-acetyltransferase
LKLLETERLYLRFFTAQDAGLLLELDADPEVMRYVSREPTSLQRLEQETIPRLLNYYLESPPRGVWAAHLRQTEEFIGWFHLRPDKFEPADAELGYRLKRFVWGLGLATEGSRALLHKGFEEWGHSRIVARTLAANLASQRVMQKIGLRFEGEFFYTPEVLPGYSEAERRAVKYGLAQEQFKS